MRSLLAALLVLLTLPSIATAATTPARAAHVSNRWLDRHIDRMMDRDDQLRVNQKTVHTRDCRARRARVRCALSWLAWDARPAVCDATAKGLECDVELDGLGEYRFQGWLEVWRRDGRARMRFVRPAPQRRLAGSEMIDSAAAAGEQFWHGRGVPAHADSLEAASAPCGHEEWAGCTTGRDVQINEAVVREAETNTVDPVARVALCAAVFHELGHTGGLDDTTDGGLMDTHALVFPWDCRVWARG